MLVSVVALLGPRLLLRHLASANFQATLLIKFITIFWSVFIAFLVLNGMEIDL